MSIKSVYQILKAIDISYENQNFELEKTLNLEELKISKHRLESILESLLNEGYIEGFYMHKDNSENIVAMNIGKPRLTLVGMDYLENNSSMKQAYKTLKEIKGWIPGM